MTIAAIGMPSSEHDIHIEKTTCPRVLEEERTRPALVSIALATYNGERFLRQQLDSLIAQSHRPIEIVACDDDSTDGTLGILADYERRYPELFRVYQNPRRLGLVKNFEGALRLVRGDFVCFCDQDDVWFPHKIERLLEQIGVRDLVHSDARIIDESGCVIASSHVEFSRKRVKAVSFGELLFKNRVTGCTVLARRSLIARAMPIPETIYHDWWCSLLAACGNGIVFTPLVLTDYRRHIGNATGPKENRSIRRGVFDLPKRWNGYIRHRSERHHRLFEIYRAIESALRDRIPIGRMKEARELAEYYRSFSSKRIRVKAFMYHSVHFRALSEGKGRARATLDWALSLVGERLL